VTRPAPLVFFRPTILILVSRPARCRSDDGYEVGAALGAQAGEDRLREVVVTDGGFSQFRRAAETPFTMVLEARP
jgi:hypothetical protein